MANPCSDEPQGQNLVSRVLVLENNQENIDENLGDLKELVKENREEIRDMKDSLQDLSNGGLAQAIQEQNELLIEKYVELGDKQREARDAKDQRHVKKEMKESEWEYKIKSKELWIGLVSGTVGMKILQFIFTVLETYLKTQGGLK